MRSHALGEKPTFPLRTNRTSRLLNGLKALSKFHQHLYFYTLMMMKLCLKRLKKWETKQNVLVSECVAQNRCKNFPVSGFCKRCESRQFILIRAPTPKALRRPVAPLCHPSTPPYFIHKRSLPTQIKARCYLEFSELRWRLATVTK